METIKFKTNIKCAGCIEKVSASLNEIVGEGNWQVDISNPNKWLTVSATVDEATLKESLKKVGYHAERI
jgi:copper chaperone CopZ